MRIRPSETISCAMRSWPFVAVLAITIGLSAAIGWAAEKESTSDLASKPDEEAVVITIVYDNNPGPKELTTAWGFGCVIQGLEKTLLFDTGGDGRILLENMRRLKLDPEEIDVVVLSHIHGDHTGGLSSFAKHRTGVPVYMPTGFPSEFTEQVRSWGEQPMEAADSEVVCPGARTTGTLGQGEIEEHGLCVKTPKGWVLITGCAHPGVANLAAKAKQITGEPMYEVMGGFHMGWHPKSKINAAIDRFEEMGTRRAVPCHCSGEPARKLFKQRLGDRCTLAGVGSIFRFQKDG